jgi:hypothetical protein
MSRLKQVHDWRNDKPTDEQILAVYKAGYSLESIKTMTKGQCSDIISEYKKNSRHLSIDDDFDDSDYWNDIDQMYGYDNPWNF